MIESSIVESEIREPSARMVRVKLTLLSLAPGR